MLRCGLRPSVALHLIVTLYVLQIFKPLNPLLPCLCRSTVIHVRLSSTLLRALHIVTLGVIDYNMEY
jgi:hypothetical protein